MFRWKPLLILFIIIAFILLLSMSRLENSRIINVVNKISQHPTRKYSKRELSQITGVVIHHTAAASLDGLEEVKRIAAYHSDPGNHICDQGCPGVGYHFMITKDGTIYQTQDLKAISYHVGGGLNTANVGVCLLGNFDEEIPSQAQYDGLIYTIKHITNKLGGSLDIFRHSDLKATSCPGTNFDMDYVEQKLTLA